MDMGEVEIRDMFGFTKTKPIVFKEHCFGDSAIKTQFVSDMKLVQLDSDGTVGSLDVTLEDGRHIRICTAYLREMQASRFTFESKYVDEE